jgi:hypothetical protein
MDKRYFSENFSQSSENKIHNQKQFKNMSLSEKENLFLELNNKFNNLYRFGNEFKNFINSIISRETENSLFKSIEIEKQEIETFKDLNK